MFQIPLDFTGSPIRTRTAHARNGNTIVLIDNFVYDHVGRLLSQTQCIGDENMGDSCPVGDGELIVYKGYDGLGQLEQKKVGGTPGTDY